MTTKFIRTYEPVNDALSLREMMNQLVESSFVNPSAWMPKANMPAIDVAESKDAYTVKAALAGWKPEDVDVMFENGVVTIKGEQNDTEEKKEDEKYHFREIRKASFSRSVTLPVEVDTDKTVAEFQNGVLTLSLPKAEVVKPKQIKIAVK